MNKGFVALSLILSAASLLLAFSFMQSVGIGLFFDQTRLKEYRLMNYYNAYSCIDQAILSISHDYFYTVSTSTQISNLNCSIDSVVDDNGFKNITTHGSYKNITVKRQARVKVYDARIEIISID